MATIRKADRAGWRPGCLVMSDGVAVPIDPHAEGEWCIPNPGTLKYVTQTFTPRKLHALITLADVTIAKACVRMP